MIRSTLAAALLLAVAASARAGDPLEDLGSADPAHRERGRAALLADDEGTLFLRALESPEEVVRESAASLLADHPDRGGPLHRAALRGLLRDRGNGRALRAAAARALGASRDAGAGADLRAALLDLPAEAALALAALGDGAALPDLRRLREAAGDAVSAEVSYALAVLGDPEGGALLLRRLQDVDPVPSASALHLLRLWTGRDLGPSPSLWIEALRLRSLAAALGDRDWEAGEKVLQAEIARGSAAGPDLLAVFMDEGAGTEARAKAALGLGLLRNVEAGPALLEASRRGRDPYLRVYALESLGRIAWAPAAPELARMLVDDEDLEVPRSFISSVGPYHEIQGTAARALLDMGCEGALALFVDQISRGGVQILPTALVGDYRIRIYYQALAAFRDYGGPGARDGFGFLPEASEADRARQAALAVAWWRGRPADLAVPTRARFGDPLFAAAVEREIGILGRYKFLEMDRSRRCLILLGSPALPHLAAALATADASSDPQGQLRVGLAQVLQESVKPEAAAPLRAALLKAELPPVRIQLLRSLAILRPEGGIPEAVGFLASSLPDERATAAEALALCPTAGTLEGLRRAGAAAARGEDATLRISIATALLGLHRAEGAAVLLEALGDADSIIRRRAWEGLDRWVEGLAPFDPKTGADAEAVRGRWAAQSGAPRFRGPAPAGR